MADSYDFCARPQQFFKFVKQHLAVIIDGSNPKLGAFFAVGALRRSTNFFPRISRERMGKSRRIFSTSNPVPTTCSRWAADSLDGILAAVVIRSPPRSFRYLRWMSRLRRCSPNLPLAADNCESIFQLARVRDLVSYGPGTRSRKQRAGACVPRARRFRVSGDRTARSRRSGQWLLRGYTSHRRRKSPVAAWYRFARHRRVTGYDSSAWRRFSAHLCER